MLAAPPSYDSIGTLHAMVATIIFSLPSAALCEKSQDYL